MRASRICENLYNMLVLEKSFSGKVHSVFNNACNIENGDNFITLLSNNKNMSPMSVLIANEEVVNFRELDINQDLNFKFTKDKIYCLEKNIYIDLRGVQKWNPGIKKIYGYITEYDLKENIKALELGVINYGKFEGMSYLVNLLAKSFPLLELMEFKMTPNEKELEFINNRFISFIEGLLKSDYVKIAGDAAGIIGYGPGLTPSMDDFISGLMISSFYLTTYYGIDSSIIYKFNKELVRLSLNKTTRVSAEMLKHASFGRSNEAVIRLMRTILTQIGREEVMEALINTMDYGETSGTDTALGIYVGCKIWTNLNYRRVWINDIMCGS